MNITPTEEQEQALQAIAAWHAAGGDTPFVLAGLAGTGKTAVLPLLWSRLGAHEVRMVAPTWKAASVLTERLRSAGRPERATSIHALIYTYSGIMHEESCSAYTWEARSAGADCDADCTEPSFTFTPGREGVKDLIVVDEASMVDEVTRRDIEALGHPVLYVGDHGQLAPVRGKSIFGERPPDYELRSIQRQVADSPIIALSRVVRARDPQWIRKAQQLGFSTDAYDINSGNFPGGDTVFIAYSNREVDDINAKVRRVLGYGPELAVGDRVVVRDNMHNLHVYNGQSGVVRAFRDEKTVLEMDSGAEVSMRVDFVSSDISASERVPGRCRVNAGYALTCHRAQGSEWKSVVLKVPRREAGSKFLYTAVTRARETLVLR